MTKDAELEVLPLLLNDHKFLIVTCDLADCQANFFVQLWFPQKYVIIENKDSHGVNSRRQCTKEYFY